MSTRLAGARMPAEWEPHAATWLVWPHNRDDWGVKTTAVEWCYVEMIRLLARGERVALVCQGRSRARARIRSPRAVRDRHGSRRSPRDPDKPFVDPRQRADFCRARGGTAQEGSSPPTGVSRDGRGTARTRSTMRCPGASHGVSEWNGSACMQGLPVSFSRGGSIDVDGEGSLLTTETCLLGRVQARNPRLSRETLELVLGRTLGVEQVLWLPGGNGESALPGDDTHGHVDNLARFVGKATVVAAETPDRDDPRYPVLAANLARLRSMRTARG